MDMRNFTILLSALTLFAFGIAIEDRGLTMMLGADGEPIYPISSGSKDGVLLKVGLYPFVLAFISSLMSYLRRSTGKTSIGIYIVCSVFYGFMVFLVALDSDLVASAKLGDWLPLMASGIWGLSIIALIWLSFNKSRKSDA